MDLTRMPPAERAARSTASGRPRCSVCNLPPGRRYLSRGRCEACYGYWQKYGRERPAHLWRRNFTSASAERCAR
jgi:hypothetical protein